MNSINELKWDELNHSYQPSDFSFRNTDEVQSISELLEQEDAIERIRQGLQIESRNYNLYVCGAHNDYMEKVVIDEVKKKACQKECPMAFGYIYNFNMPEQPLIVALKAIDARQLQEDLEEFRTFILNDIPILLEEDEVKQRQETLIEEFEKLTEKYFMDIAEKAERYNVQIKKTNEGIRFAPLNEKGEGLTKEVFLKMPQIEQEAILEKISQLQDYTDEIMIFLERKEDEYLRLYSEVREEVVLKEIGKNIKKLKETYKDYSCLQNYFNSIAEDFLEHLELFASMSGEEDEQQENRKEIHVINQEVQRIVRHYDINFLNIPKELGVPIINDRDYVQLDLVGKILLDIENNTVQSDFLHIRPGMMNLANGGYLILHIEDLIEKKSRWQHLKSVLKTGKMYIEGTEEIGIALTTPLKPEPVPIQVKVILIGDYATYELLKNYDEDFKKLFKMRVAFDETIDINIQKVEHIAGNIKQRLIEENIKPLSVEGLLHILTYGCRKMEHPTKISSDLEWMIDLLREAQLYAKEQIGKEEIEKCLRERERYERKAKEQLDESLQDGTYLIDTKGSKIGQINGLAVYSIGDLSFGRPLRITATTYRGKSGIVDIENEAKLSGSIHTKGIHIITGFLGNQFAQEIPLSLNCNICFEQSYVGVDGDSASSAELYAILSSLAETPIYQNIAVTGSVNQFGEIQPVGGINEKIEGFYQVCKQRGLTGSEGVMIPQNNVKELMLASEVVEAVRNKTFHIYAIKDIWEGVEIMMDENRERVKARIVEKLIRFNK